MKSAVAAGVAWLLAIWLGPGCAAELPERPRIEVPTMEQRFGPLSFQLPAGYAQVEDKTEQLPSRIPGAAPAREHFRTYVGPHSRRLYLFHWEGSPQRDRGPMRAEQTWEVTIDGQPATVSQTDVFFGRAQRVLSAHFKSPYGDDCLIYQESADPTRAPEREPFLALLSTIRFEPESIGMATMLIDGTILLQLRAADSAGALGDALLSYPPSNPRYKVILEDLGGLTVGERKPVKRFESGK